MTREDPRWNPDAATVRGAEAFRDQCRAMLQWAILAPSSHNTQPWLFRIAEDHVDLFADRSRALPVVDPDDRELLMSCGAALFHLRVTMAHFGHDAETELFPDPNEPDHLARVRRGSEHSRGELEERLFHAITRRRTHRGPFDGSAIAPGVLNELSKEASEEGVTLVPVTEAADRAAVADLVAEGDRIQMHDRRFRRELAAWLRGNHSHRNDGIPGYAMGMNDVVAATGPLVVRLFDLGDGSARRDRALTEGSPALGVLLTEGDAEPQWLAAGQALARVLLDAESRGIRASYLNQPVERPELRNELRSAVQQHQMPQLVLRLGYASDRPRPTPRRPVEEVTLGPHV
jgi:nitroreductase